MTHLHLHLHLLLVLLAIAGVTAWCRARAQARLARLQARVVGACHALDVQLVQRAEAVRALAASGVLDPAAARALEESALACLTVAPGLGPHRLDVESALSRLLRAVLDRAAVDWLEERSPQAANDLARAGLRVQLAARCRADVVDDLHGAGLGQVMTLLGLSGRARHLLATCTSMTLDDRLPEALAPARTMHR